MSRTLPFTLQVAVYTCMKVAMRPHLYYLNPLTNRYEFYTYVVFNYTLLFDSARPDQVPYHRHRQAQHPFASNGTSSAFTSSYIEVVENMPSPAISEGSANEIQEILNEFLETSIAGLASDGEDFIDLARLSPDIEVFEQFWNMDADDEMLEEMPTPINEN